MKWKERAKWFIRQRLRYARGSGYLADVRSLILLALLFKSYGIMEWIIIPVGIIYTGILWMTGYIDERKGVWKYEAKYASEVLNPTINGMKRDIKRLIKDK